MIRLIRLPAELLPSYRTKQKERLLLNLRVSLLAGAIVSLFFLPWGRWHDPTDQLPTIELGVGLSAGLLVALAISFLEPAKRHVDYLTLVAAIGTLGTITVYLIVLPNGFLYGVGTLLSYTVVVSVLAVDLPWTTTAIVGVCYLVVPNAALLMSGAPWLTIMNTNWILVSGGMVAFGLAIVIDQTHRNSFTLERDLEVEKERADTLLKTLLPDRVAERLKRSDDQIADVVPDATVLFADLAGFTPLTRTLSPNELISLLTNVFTGLDEIATRRGLEKIKTIGDAYMLSSGVADATDRTTCDVAAFAIDAAEFLRRFVVETGYPLNLRIGIATGPVICGVIGRRKPHFDIWGLTVNLASRLETTAPQGGIHTDSATARVIGDVFHLERRGQVALEGIGEVETYRLIGHRSEVGVPKGPSPLRPVTVTHPALQTPSAE